LPDPSEHRLIERLEDAYQRYRQELRNFFARKSRDPQTVDDLIQTMYLSLKKTRPPQEVRDPRQYLFGVAWNLLHDANRRAETERARRVGCNYDEFDAYADRSNRLWVEDDATSEQQRFELERVLSQLPAACQVAVIRQYRDNRSYAEIARELGVTTHTVKKYIVRALNHFRAHFNSRDLDAAREGKRR
jgi:RNA polymerase sigma factor (sigma-70 family)